MAKGYKKKRVRSGERAYIDIKNRLGEMGVLDNKPVAKYVKRGSVDEYRAELVIRTTPVCWGVPCDEVMYTKFFANTPKLGVMPWDGWAITESTYLPSARNTIHNNFLEMSDIKFLMMLDSDVLTPPDMVTKLIAHGKHLVGGWYKNKVHGEPPHPVVYDFVTDEGGVYQFRHRDNPGNGLERVTGMGAGCWLMSRELAEALGKNPYSFEHAGEDLTVSYKVMKLGYEMWVDWDIQCAHAGVSWV